MCEVGRERERERGLNCAYMKERESVRVCVCVRARERIRTCLCEREMNACVCEKMSVWARVRLMSVYV